MAEPVFKPLRLSMYYVTDPYHPELKQQLRAAVLQQQAARATGAPVLHVYALVDGAMDEAWGHALWRESQSKPQELRAVYAGTPLEEAEEAGLFLGGLQEEQVDLLLGKARARPMLSFLQSSLSLDAMCAHLVQFSRGQTADGYWFPLRWGCPNRVADLMAAIGEPLANALRSGFAAWHLIDRSGSLQTIQGALANTEQDLKPEGMLTHGFVLSDAAFSQLLDAGEADLILSRELTQLPEEIQGRDAVLLHAMARAMLSEMDAAGINAHRARSELLIRSLRSDSFESAQALVKAYAS